VDQAPIEQAIPLVQRALEVLTDREVSPQLGLLKSTLLQLDSTFSERSYGANSFRDFAEKLEAAGLVTLRHSGRNILVELKDGSKEGPNDLSREAGEPAETTRAVAPAPRVVQRAGDVSGLAEAARPDIPGIPRDTDAPPVIGGIGDVRRIFSRSRPQRFPMYIRNVKQLLRQTEPGFDERRYGFANLVDLLRAAQREGIVRLERDRQGALRVFQGPQWAPSPEAAVAAGAELEVHGAAPIEETVAVSEQPAGEPPVIEAEVVAETSQPARRRRARKPRSGQGATAGAAKPRKPRAAKSAASGGSRRRPARRQAPAETPAE
jgi:hypothetical protein